MHAPRAGGSGTLSSAQTRQWELFFLHHGVAQPGDGHELRLTCRSGEEEN